MTHEKGCRRARERPVLTEGRCAILARCCGHRGALAMSGDSLFFLVPPPCSRRRERCGGGSVATVLPRMLAAGLSSVLAAVFVSAVKRYLSRPIAVVFLGGSAGGWDAVSDGGEAREALRYRWECACRNRWGRTWRHFGGAVLEVRCGSRRRGAEGPRRSRCGRRCRGAEGEGVVHRDKVAADSEEGSQRPAWTRGGAEPPEGRTRAAAELQSPCGAVPARVQRLRQQRYHRPVERGISTPVRPG